MAQVDGSATQTIAQFAQIEPTAVAKALKKARTTWSVGIDDVPMAILKKVAPAVVPHITAITNAIVSDQFIVQSFPLHHVYG